MRENTTPLTSRVDLRTLRMTTLEKSRWRWLVLTTGLRTQDVVRRALRVLWIVMQADSLGRRIVVKHPDGTETELMLV